MSLVYFLQSPILIFLFVLAELVVWSAVVSVATKAAL